MHTYVHNRYPAHFGRNVFSDDNMGSCIDMSGQQQSSMATDFSGAFAKYPHTDATGLGRTTVSSVLLLVHKLLICFVI